MSDASDYAAAFKELKRMAQPDASPVLSYGDGVTADEDKELDAILLEAKRATTWAAATVYVVGQEVMPTVRNGHRYRVTQAGTSGATEPTWPMSEYGTVTNGSSNPVLTFEEAGLEYSNIYDVRAAKRAVCELKMSKSAERAAFSADGGSFQRQQVFEHWERMSKRFASVGVS